MDSPNYEFALYTAGHGPNSIKAIGQVKRLLEAELPGAYELKIVDIVKDPQVARDHGVMAAPTLIRVAPQPTRRIIGALGDSESVIERLDLTARPVQRARRLLTEKQPDEMETVRVR